MGSVIQFMRCFSLRQVGSNWQPEITKCPGVRRVLLKWEGKRSRKEEKGKGTFIETLDPLYNSATNSHRKNQRGCQGQRCPTSDSETAYMIGIAYSSTMPSFISMVNILFPPTRIHRQALEFVHILIFGERVTSHS